MKQPSLSLLGLAFPLVLISASADAVEGPVPRPKPVVAVAGQPVAAPRPLLKPVSGATAAASDVVLVPRVKPPRDVAESGLESVAVPVPEIAVEPWQEKRVPQLLPRPVPSPRKMVERVAAMPVPDPPPRTAADVTVPATPVESPGTAARPQPSAGAETDASPAVTALVLPTPSPRPTASEAPGDADTPSPYVKPGLPENDVHALCDRVGSRLASVSVRECRTAQLVESGAHSVKGTPIVVTRFASAATTVPHARVLVVGGTHGDEFSSVSVVFKWMDLLNKGKTGPFEWRVAPLLNPDGLFANPATRTNANGVDLNRNFPTPNWLEESRRYWVQKTGKNPRRFPGVMPMSEPESRWLVTDIGTFEPDVIIATHAPHGVVDFDGPPHGPQQLGSLNMQLLGTFPGSLGNFAGVHRDLPVVTVEFASASAMPDDSEIEKMWEDLLAWLLTRFPEPKQLRAKLGDI